MTDIFWESPPEQELPPGRHNELRSQVLRELSGRPVRRPLGLRSNLVRHRLVPVLAGVAVLVVIAGVLGFLLGSQRRPAPVAQQQDTVEFELSVPGYTADELKAVRDNCLKSLTFDPDSSLLFGSVPVDEMIDVDSLRVYNVKSDSAGTMALLYGKDGSVNCTWVAQSAKGKPDYTKQVPSASGVDDQNPNWLPGAASVDGSSGRMGSGSRDYRLLGGRVPSQVAKVEISLDGQSVTVTPVNGTYLATLWFGPTHPGHTGQPRIRTYNVAGHLVGDYTKSTSDICVVTPDGTQISGPDRTDKTNCTEAVAWR